MNSLVVYDSQYGNTEKIAQAIAHSLSAKAVRAAEVNKQDFHDLKLLVVGSPTQGGRPTAALQQFLDQIPAGSLKDVQVAAFDTRFLESELNFALKLLIKTLGYAAPRIAESLQQKSGKLLIPPEGFIVKGKPGPLAPGELERAASWLKSR